MFIQYHEMAQILFHILIAMCRNIHDSITLYIITLKTSSKRRKFENANVRINRHWKKLTYFINFGTCCVIVYVTHLSPGSCFISPPSGIVNPGGYIMGPPGLHKTQTHVFTWRQQTCQHIWTSCVKSLKWVCLICNQVWKQVYSTVIGLLADL